MTLRLDQLPFRKPANVVAIDWAALSDADALRLRNLGLDEGVQVEALHGAAFGRDPMAVRIGRMMLAMRRNHARVISVEPVAEIALKPEHPLRAGNNPGFAAE